MAERTSFQFWIPRPQGQLIEMSPQEMEAILLKRLEDEKSQPGEALWQLASFYQQHKDTEKGLSCLRRFLDVTPDAENKATAVLGMGQMMETAQDFAAAVQYYKEAFALEPINTLVCYLIHNNLGFSLNQLSKFGESETYCRKAIEIDPSRPNAFKNLGIALAAQGQFHDAAQCFVQATQVNAADPRAFHLLEILLKEHPELEYEFQHQVNSCQAAVEMVAKKSEELKPVVYRGWRKRLILFHAKIQSISKKSAD